MRRSSWFIVPSGVTVKCVLLKLFKIAFKTLQMPDTLREIIPWSDHFEIQQQPH